MATNCTNCGCSKISCGCGDSFLTTPPPCPTPVDCPEAQPCAEVFDAACVVYTGPNLQCGLDDVVLTNTPLNLALEDIIGYFCENTGPTTIINEGSGIDVTSTTVGNTVTYTIALASPAATTVVEAGAGIDVDVVTVGNTTTYTVSVIPKDIAYFENVETVAINTAPVPNVYNFPSVGYATLTYTNSTSSTKTYKVYGSYDSNFNTISPNNTSLENWVDGAIIKTVLLTDTVLWQSLGTSILSGFLFWGPSGGQTIGSGTPTHLLIDDQGSNVQFRFLNASIPRNVSFFQIVTLNAGETVSLKFKTKDNTSASNLLAAQFMVEEV